MGPATNVQSEFIHATTAENTQNSEIVSNDSCSCMNFVIWIAFLLLISPFVTAIIPDIWSNAHSSVGVKFCDTNRQSISAYMDMTCLPCPISAKYCIGGKAWCRNWDVFDAETHSCVQMSYQENVIAH